MSIARATTQLIKSRVTVAIKMSSLEAQKKSMLDAVNTRYANTESELKMRLDESHNALLALGYSEDQIKYMSNEYCVDNKLPAVD